MRQSEMRHAAKRFRHPLLMLRGVQTGHLISAKLTHHTPHNEAIITEEDVHVVRSQPADDDLHVLDVEVAIEWHGIFATRSTTAFGEDPCELRLRFRRAGTCSASALDASGWAPPNGATAARYSSRPDLYWLHGRHAGTFGIPCR